MKPNIRLSALWILACATVVILLASSFLATAASKTHQFVPGEKAKISGQILSRDGDLVRLREKKSENLVVIRINDDTTIERQQHKFPFYRHTDMDVTALLPGLTIEAEGVGTSTGELDARKISFTPDDFAVEVAEERQVLTNKASAQNAQSTADRAAASASQAQTSADQAGVEAQTAGVVALADADAVAGVNQRVSDLDQYKNEFEVDVFFREGSTVLDDAAKRDLANLADIAKSLNGYMIEISGYAAHHKFSLEEDQKLSEQRAAVVARYFLEAKSIPIRRILIPVGYGATQPVAGNSDPHGRELNRHVDVKVIVNKGLGQGM